MVALRAITARRWPAGVLRSVGAPGALYSEYRRSLRRRPSLPSSGLVEKSAPYELPENESEHGNVPKPDDDSDDRYVGQV